MGARPLLPPSTGEPTRDQSEGGCSDCNARDRRRLRRRARALLFRAARSWSASPWGGARGSGGGGQKTRRQPHLSACRTGCRAARLSQLRVNSQRTANRHRTLRRALEHSADYAGPAAARPQARTVGGVRARELRSITRSRVFRWLLITRPTAHNLCVMFGCPPKAPFQGEGGLLFRTEGERCSVPRNQHHSATSSCSSSCASASKAASSASALEVSGCSSAASGAITRTDRGFPGWVAVWISFKRRIETWV